MLSVLINKYLFQFVENTVLYVVHFNGCAKSGVYCVTTHIQTYIYALSTSFIKYYKQINK